MKKAVLVLVTGSILASSFSPIVASASSLDEPSNEVVLEETVEDNQVENDQLKYDSFLEEIKPYVYKNMQGTIEIGNYPESIASTYSNEIELLESQLAPQNQQVLDGKLIVTEDLAYVPAIQLFASKNGATAYWWGFQYILTNAQAKQFATGMDDFAFGSISLSTFASRIGLSQIATALATVGAPYYKQLAIKVRQKNTKKGVIINVTRLAVFTVKSR